MRQVLPAFEPYAGNRAISPNGQFLAVAVVEAGKPELLLCSLEYGGAPRKLPMPKVDPDRVLKPTGIAFMPMSIPRT